MNTDEHRPRRARWTRRAVRALAVVTIPALVAVVAATPSEAASISPGAKIVKSACTSQSSQIPYAGGYKYDGVWPSRWASGKVYVCYTKYRLTDADPKADYYALVVTSHWTYSSGARSYPARMYQFIASNTAAISNVYGSTPSFTGSKSCSSAISVGFGVGPFSISTSPTLCKSYKVTRTAYTSSRSNWTSTQAGGLKTVETVFSEKVKNGKVPLFEAHVAIPQYKHYWTGSAWQTSEAFRWVDWYKV